MTQAKLAKMFGLRSPSAIANRLRRYRDETGERYRQSLGPKTRVRPISLSMTPNV